MQPKNLQRIAATLAEESMPTDTEMKREGMLYRYLRDYAPSSPMQSPLDPPQQYYEDPYDDDSPNWWTTPATSAGPSGAVVGGPGPTTDPSTNLGLPSLPFRRDSSPAVDPMDTTSGSGSNVATTPIAVPSPRRGSMVAVGGEMSVSPMTIMPPPPIIPHVQRMKRKGNRLPWSWIACVASCTFVAVVANPLLPLFFVSKILAQMLRVKHSLHIALRPLSPYILYVRMLTL